MGPIRFVGDCTQFDALPAWPLFTVRSRSPHYSRVLRFLEVSELTPILGSLVRDSALPLRAMEVDFAVDATGFSAGRFIRSFDKKYGIVRYRLEFLTGSIMTSVRTNIIIAVRIGGQDSGDSPDFIPMLKATPTASKTMVSRLTRRMRAMTSSMPWLRSTRLLRSRFLSPQQAVLAEPVARCSGSSNSTSRSV